MKYLEIAVIAAAVLVLAVGASALIFNDDNNDDDTFVDETGNYYAYDVSGSSREFTSSTTVSGTYTYYYMYYSESRSAYYVQTASDYTYATTYVFDSSSNSSTEKSSTDEYWTDDDEDLTWYDPSRTETLTYNGESILCNVYYTTFTEGNVTYTEYVWMNNDVTYKMYVTTGSSHAFGSYSCTYTLSSIGIFTPSTSTTLDVYTDPGITVTGNTGTYSLGDSVTLTADTDDGYTFGGWYDEYGNLLSTDATYTLTVEGSAVVAANGSDPDSTVTEDADSDGSPEVNISEILSGLGISAVSGTWSAYNLDTGEDTVSGAAMGTDQEMASGHYLVFVTGSDGTTLISLQLTVDGTIVYTWTYDGDTYTISLDISYSDYETFVDTYTVSERCTYYYSTDSTAHDITFVNTTSTADDSYIESFVSQLNIQLAANGVTSDQEKINVLLAFVGSDAITYTYDSTAHGTDEYWQFPLETLYLKTGDCEDTSILFCAIAKEMGYTTALLLYNGHMSAGVSISDYTASSSSGTSNVSVQTSGDDSLTDGTNSYYYCETTASGWKVGWIPSDIGDNKAVEAVGTA